MATINDPSKKHFVKDKELQNPKHDEILSWLYRNVAGLIGGVGKYTFANNYVEEKTEEAHDSLRAVVNELRKGMADSGKRNRDRNHPCVPNTPQEVKWLKKQTAFYEQFVDDITKFKEFLAPVPNFPGVIVDQIKLQSPIYDRSMKRKNYLYQNNKIIGFMDMEAEIYNPVLKIGGISRSFRKNTSEWIAPALKFNTPFDSDSTTWYFDVRTTVENTGVLLREIEVLRNALEVSSKFVGQYAVVAPQTELSFRILENQDIKPIDYNPEIEFDPKNIISSSELKQNHYEFEDEILPFLTYPTYIINEFDE